MKQLWANRHITTLEYLPYSPDLTSSDFYFPYTCFESIDTANKKMESVIYQSPYLIDISHTPLYLTQLVIYNINKKTFQFKFRFLFSYFPRFIF